MKKILLPLMVVIISIISLGMISVSAETEEIYTYSVSNGEVSITGCDTSASGALIIPATIGGYPVTSIGRGAFSACKSLESITLPEGVTSIGNSAFFSCEQLTSITIPTSITRISGNVFTGCKNLNRVDIFDIAAWCKIIFEDDVANPLSYADNLYLNGKLVANLIIPSDVTKIGDRAFQGCSSIESLTISNGVTTIGTGTFRFCRNLKKVTMPDSITTIGATAFCECSSLGTVAIPISVTHIGYQAFAYCDSITRVIFLEDVEVSGDAIIDDSAFEYCSNLESVAIPNGVISIGGGAFEGCSNLERVAIPASITSIGERAFYRCSSLTDVYYTDTKEEWDEVSIDSNNSYLLNATIHFMPNTRTTLSNNDKTFTISPINIENGKTVILVLYNGDKFVEMQSAAYTGEELSFTTAESFTKAKVMVWDNLTSLKPVCNIEIIK